MHDQREMEEKNKQTHGLTEQTENALCLELLLLLYPSNVLTQKSALPPIQEPHSFLLPCIVYMFLVYFSGVLMSLCFHDNLTVERLLFWMIKPLLPKLQCILRALLSEVMYSYKSA